MIKKNKTQVILSTIVTLLPIVAGLIMWNILPERIATHWNASGEIDGWSGKSFAIFGLPVIMLAAHWLCILVTAHDPKNSGQNDKIFKIVLWILPITSLITSGAVYAIALGSDISIDLMVRVLIGLMFVLLGNYLPKCKQNHTIGVKITWTLQNEENWNKTHRFTGRLWVLGGIFILATMFIPMKSYGGVFVMVLLLLSFLPMIYSYVYHRKQVKAGTASAPKEKAQQSPWEKKFTIVSLIFGAIVTVFVVVLLVTGDIRVQFADSSFTVKAAYWEDAAIDYADIESIEYRKQDNPGVRTFGFGSFKLLMGDFENDEFGKYTRYSYAKCASSIVLTVKGEIFVLNGADEESTREIYEELLERCGK